MNMDYGESVRRAEIRSYEINQVSTYQLYTAMPRIRGRVHVMFA